jgi:hypothetical protein
MRSRARHDVDYLCQVIGAPLLPPHAKAIYSIIRANKAAGKKTVILTAPGCLKSTVLSIVMLEDLLGPDPHILFASASDKVVKRTGAFLRDAVARVYGADRMRAASCQTGWRDSDEVFTVPTWTPASRDASWVGTTLGTNIEGVRANQGYLDDVTDEKSTTSEVYRETALRWLKMTFLDRLNGNPPVVAVGSLWHQQDLHMTLMSEGWDTHIYPFHRHPMPPDFAQYPNVIWHGDAELLWPERWQGVDLQQIVMDKGGPVSFSLRFLCDASSLKTARIKPDWFKYFDMPLSPDIMARLTIHMAIDPATGKSDIGSETAITTVGKDRTTNWEYILESIAGNWQPVERKDQILASYQRWHPELIFVEDVGAQADLVSELKVLDLPARGLSPGGKDKIGRIDTLCVPIFDGIIRFHLSQQELIHQLLNFPGGRRLDRADSLEIAHRSFASARVPFNWKRHKIMGNFAPAPRDWRTGR